MVQLELRYLDQRPFRAVQRTFIERAIQRHALQLAIRRITPGVIRADEQRGVALLVAADLHPAMAAGIQEHVHRALCIAAQDYRFLAHTGNEEVAWIWNLAFVADEQPCAG